MTKLPITVTLDRPIMVDGEERAQLTFDEPDVAADLAWLEFMEGVGDEPTPAEAMRASVFWWARMSGLSEEDVGRIKATDHDKVSAAVDKVFAAIGRDLPGEDPAGEDDTGNPEGGKGA